MQDPSVQSIASQEEVEEELDLVCRLLWQTWGLGLVKPALYLGNEHESKFIQISSMSDFGRASHVQMVFDANLKGIYVPSRLLGNKPTWLNKNPKAHRVYCFLHECTHAVIEQMNPLLGEEEDESRGYVYATFHEGMANYLSISACLRSCDLGLAERGAEEDQGLRNGFEKWISSREFSLMVVGGPKPKDWQEKLWRYFVRNPELLIAYKYLVGFRFVSEVSPSRETIQELILHPPSKVHHLIYPKSYLREVKGE